MSRRVVVMSEEEYDDAMSGLDNIPFDVERTNASNGKFIRTVITVSKSKLEAALKARDFDDVKPDDGSEINYGATVVWND